VAAPEAVERFGGALTTVLPGAIWVAWWLWAVNWKRLWPVLAQGAWAPVLLLVLIVAVVWSRLAPGDCACLGFAVVPNFWWQLGSVSTLVALALFSGWLQGLMGWAPPEVDLEPPAHAADNGHLHHH
jgi:hypothetical protein